MKNTPKLNTLQESFAVVLCGIIQSDGTVSQKERKKFDDFFAKEFELSKEEAQNLLEKALNETDYDKHIARLKEELKDMPMCKMKFMQYLNEIILSDGIGKDEYEFFEMVRSKLI